MGIDDARRERAGSDGITHRFIEAQVDRTPDSVALVFDGESVSYRELEARANQLAHHLIAKGATTDQPIGVLLERSRDMVVSLLAILKAGAAFLPIDPTHPRDRVLAMLSDARCSHVVGHAAWANLIEGSAVKATWLDTEPLHALPSSRPVVAVNGDNLAYVLFTSGSTGKPKGAMNTHAGLANRLAWMQEALALAPDDVVVQKTPFTFDVSVWEFFWPLMFGARLVVAKPEGHRDPAYLADLFRQHGVTTIHFVPSMLAAFLDGTDTSVWTSVRRVICSGEALSAPLQAAFFARSTAPLINLYGPTEAAIDVSMWRCRDSGDATIPIGYPVANTQLYILGDAMQQLRAGETGELFIGGVQLARGYLRRPAMTAERFVPDPLGSGRRLYRTGDLARYREDGAIEFLGRIDDQVKIRGYRIELGEIEHALASHSAVKHCAVVARANELGDKQLVAYVAPTTTALTSVISELRAHLGKTLPDYMVPAVFGILNELPLSSSGKTDRRALAALDLPRATSHRGEPRGQHEAAMAAMWSTYLGAAQIGREDRFLELGGHSISAARLVAAIQAEHGVTLPLRLFLGKATLAETAAALALAISDRGVVASGAEPMARRTDPQTAPMSIAQQGVWLFEQLRPGTRAYVECPMLRIRGGVNADALERALDELAARHEIWRTGFATEKWEPIQRIAQAIPLALRRFSIGHVPAEDRERELRAVIAEQLLAHPFDLAKPPLIRCGLIELGPDDHVLALPMHHLITDAWSEVIMAEELARIYDAVSQGQPMPPRDVMQHYGDFALWERTKSTGSEWRAARAFWRTRLADAPAALLLPASGPGERADSTTLDRSLTAASSQRVYRYCRANNISLSTVLYAVFAMQVSPYAVDRRFLLPFVYANRSGPVQARMLGVFATRLLVVIDLDRARTFDELVERLRADLLEAIEHVLPFEQIAHEMGGDPTARRRRLGQVAVSTQLPVAPIRGGNVTFTPDHWDVAAAIADLVMLVREREGDRIDVVWRFNPSSVAPATASKLADEFEVVLNRALAGVQRP